MKPLLAGFRFRLSVFFMFAFCFAGSAVVMAAEGEGEAKLDPLAWNTDLALWNLIIFLVLVVVLGKFAFKPIVKALDAREQAMADKVAAAEKANTDARDLLNQYQQKLADSEQEVRQMLESARADAEMRAQSILDKARDAAEQEHQRALKEIDAATDNALRGLAEKSADLATELAGKILKEKICPADHAELIGGAIRQFTRN